MANTKELRRRIKSIKNTSQITKAMQMVAATKMRKTQTQALSGRPYIQALNFALNKLEGVNLEDIHPFLKSNQTKKAAILLLTTDKSLCGALNTNLFRLIQQFVKENSEIQFFTVGKKGRQFVVKTGKNLIADFENQEVITFRFASQISRLLIEAFLKKEVSDIYIVYPDFISTLRQEAVLKKILPVTPEELQDILNESKQKSSEQQLRNEFLFEPDVLSLLDYILTHAVETKIYQALLETKASEHSARMIAMQNATDNANELVSDLQLTYNQIRQESITKELLEIASASVALE